MTTECYEASFVLFANVRRDTINFEMPGPSRFIVQQMPGVCPGGGVFATGTDSHIITLTEYFENQFGGTPNKHHIHKNNNGHFFFAIEQNVRHLCVWSIGGIIWSSITTVFHHKVATK